MYRFIAVIPARAGSRGIPNKNIRLINGKPLVSYAINNALKSQYINKVIVTSDSENVLSIARRMGAADRKRCKKLCADEVTLDGVIYDAVKDEDCDFVVTMQPTSPTLNHLTLDAAISYMIKGGYDTIISCKNDPRLSWKKDNNNKIVPNYEKRVNRQYMSPEYVETGAFLITKKEFVKENTRLGNKIGVFEIPDNESIDIDTFDDFLLAKNVLNRKKIAFYTNGSSEMGTGHIRRVLTLSDEFNSKPDIYYNSTITDVSIFGDTTHNILPVKNEMELINYICANKYDVLINDTLDTEYFYMKSLHEKYDKIKIINFDDIGKGALFADLVINPFYEGNDSDKTRFGDKYFIINNVFRLFESINISDKVDNIFISFGGADPADYTNKIANIITKKKYNNKQFVLVIGNAYKNAEAIKKMCEKKYNITIYQNISNIYEYMLEADLAISSRGITSYELGSLGIPTITIAENKLEESHVFLSDDNGYHYLGYDPSLELIENEMDTLIESSREERLCLQNKLLSCDLKNGILRVKKLIEEIGEKNDK